jgi:hypothetical protein
LLLPETRLIPLLVAARLGRVGGQDEVSEACCGMVEGGELVEVGVWADVETEVGEADEGKKSRGYHLPEEVPGRPRVLPNQLPILVVLESFRIRGVLLQQPLSQLQSLQGRRHQFEEAPPPSLLVPEVDVEA